MPDLLSIAGNLFDFLQVVIGFSLIIVVHELGHFLAARWAGIRVLAFAVGFGPAACSYRKGLGFRAGSSDAEYHALDPARARSVSPTEYRLNWLPLGGYVKMLGQDDADPTATSNEPDSYQNAPVWKRMIVISAGVLFNLITAALLFILVFMVGLETQPPTIGLVDSRGPAAKAVATNAEAAGVTEPGLKPGDQIVAIDGETPEEFTDLIVNVAMAAPGQPVRIDIRRAEVDDTLHFQIKPERDSITGFLGVGVATSDISTTLNDAHADRERELIRQILADAGLTDVEPGMTLATINGQKAVSAFDLARAAEQSSGEPITLTFTSGTGKTVEQNLSPLPQIQTAVFKAEGGAKRSVDHLLGFPPLIRAATVLRDSARDAGLRPGDLFSRLGTVEWPTHATGIPEIQRHAGKDITARVLRENEDGEWITIALDLPVDRAGTIGFDAGSSAAHAAFIAAWPDLTLDENEHEPWQHLHPATSLGDFRGRRILAVNGQPVESLLRLREVLRVQTAAEHQTGADAATVILTVERPADYPNPVTLDIPWTLDRETLAFLHDDDKLGWHSPLSLGYFKPKAIPLRAENPAAAVAMGLRRTHRVMTMTYLTFVRLFQGSVKVEHLKGPVGIAHLGTAVADRGFIWLLFFLALISVNLAVINFLPIPIADGGHFVFLLYEQVTGRPPPLAVQNAAAIAGLVLIASVFIVVTFNDIKNLF